MNKRYPLLVALCACLLLSSASLYGQDGFSAGAKVIGNVNMFDATSAGVGFGLGGFATLPIFGPFSGRAELNYVNFSGTMDDATATFENSTVEAAAYSDRKLRFQTLEIPLMAVVNVPFFKTLNPKFAVGYAYAFNMGVFQISDNTYSIQDATGIARSYEYKNTSENVSSEFEPYNSSILASLSVNFERIHVDLRYQHGLVNMSQMQLETSRYYGKFSSRTLAISVGYRFL